MEISVEFQSHKQSFRTRIAGVTKRNSDGTDRQALIRKLRRGEELKLVREPHNPYDKYAVAVLRSSGEQLGYVPAGDRRLANHIDTGGLITAKVVGITGGPGILGLFLASFRKSYGCVIEISKGDINWKEAGPYMDKSREIENLIKTTHDLESQDPMKAICLYRKAVGQIMALDKAGSLAAAWRRARYPINRLSLLLEKNGDIEGAYEEILRYEQFNDAYGLTSADQKSVTARKQRLLKKLNTRKG